MWQSIITVTSGIIIGGGLAGGLISWLSTHRTDRDVASPVVLPTDPATSAWADEVADEWATTNGRPEARQIIADKLRLGAALRERRNTRGRQPW